MTRTMNSILLSILMWGSTGCSHAGGDLSLVSGGRSQYTIVTPATPTKAENKAAGILQDYIQQISGARLPIMTETSYKGNLAIYVGNTRATTGPEKIKDDGFFNGTADQSVYIRGGSGKGVVYGAYHLLDTYLHCRKMSGLQKLIPTSKDIRIPGNMKDLQEPAFIYRESYYPASTDPEYLEWHGLQRFEDLWGLWGHSFFKIIPPKTYFDSHPEYYSMVNGSRQPLQLCLSNEEVFNLTVAYFKKAIADNPDAMYWSISPMDGAGACTCELCKKADAEEGSQAGSLIRFVNKVAAQFPEQRFTTLAYGYTSKAPSKTKPASNVYILLSTIDAYRQTPLETAPSAAGFRKNLQDWENSTGNLFIWDYTTQFTNYLCPFPDYNNVAANMRYFSAHHVKGVFSQGSGDTYGDAAEYNSYLQAALLWNPQADPAAVTDDFMKSYYKNAAPYMQQYVKALIAAVAQTKAVLDIYGSPIYSGKDYLSPTLIDQYSALLDKAEAAAENDSVLLRRVLKARLPLEYTVLQQSRAYGTEKFGYLVPNGNGYSVNPKWPNRVQRFTNLCKMAVVKELSEDGASPDAYLQEWNKLFNQKWIGGLAFKAPVTLANPYTPEYSPMKEKTLTDGLFGNTDFSYNWLFTYGKDLVATVDMGSSKSVKQISLNFLQDPRHNIYLPGKIRIEVSADGSHYKEVGVKNIPAPEEDYTAQIMHYQFPVSGTARYIRVTGQRLAAIPSWRDAGSKLPATCCDEIVVE
ncbi:F5/8 type C domain-containing protein [Chitinophaga dinghuensis]|uniref:F5/8 type C domain-containing protein n=1 Tax=Chitinophaga dinghuensis TaxID=1539050 RepID=A0A327VYK3_9BACT|nr:DUF4838 domain-containing protein [Chitinophaga dinghuensis]RAJ82049.1 F5/8 type C domain-containing protein [Chitinophaga dinghuensis]